MTIDPLYYQRTSSIASPGRLYAADIEVSHPQLRNFISTAYQDTIFYANRYDVYILDLATQQRSILVTIPFEARCLAAAHGWVCVGGEQKGDCAFIHIGEHNGRPGNFCHELLVEMLGKEIVNSMTIQLLKPNVDGYENEVVVLISNNDHTVTIYSLTQRTVLTAIEHPQPMNHAVLCPDSTILATVGDENRIYFMMRSLDVESSEIHTEGPQFAIYDWRPLATPDVPRGVFEGDDYGFAVSFSPNGRLCAVSSQGGAITVFDMEAVAAEAGPAEDAIICSFRSSRESLSGCVRSMAFSPAPWDLLAWAEDHGRIGLADLRQGFMRRQQIDLTRHKAKEVSLHDKTPQEWKTLDVKERLQRQHQQRMQTLRGHPPTGARVLSGGRPGQANTPPYPGGDAPTFHGRERSIIRSLDSTVDEIRSPPGPFSISYNSTEPSIRPSASTFGSGREYEVQLLNPGTSRHTSSLAPRRRSSVVLSEPRAGQHLDVEEGGRMTMTASPGPMSDDSSRAPVTVDSLLSPARLRIPQAISQASFLDDLNPPMSTNDLTPTAGHSSSQPLPYNIPPSDPWHVIEASLANSRIRPDASGLQRSALLQIESAIYAERQLATRLERQLEDEQRLSAMLRSELEARERLLDIQQRALPTTLSDEHTSPSLGRLLQRQLYSERDHGIQRSEELEAEIRNMSHRVDQLMDERDLLLQRQRILREEAENHGYRSTSELPTTSTRRDPLELDRRIQSMDNDRRERAQRISELEHQVRRAESRVELASMQSNVERHQARVRGLTSERAILPALPIPGSFDAAASSSTLVTPTTPAMSNTLAIIPIPAATPTTPLRLGSAHQHAELISSVRTANRTTVPRGTDTSGGTSTSASPSASTSASTSASNLPNPTRIPDNELRLARLILNRGSADGNGNGSPAAAHRYFAGGGVFASRNAIGLGASQRGLEEDSGVGTAGIGWSPDGLSLFAGTEKGIFEFTINVQDRLQSPVLEMR